MPQYWIGCHVISAIVNPLMVEQNVWKLSVDPLYVNMVMLCVGLDVSWDKSVAVG